MIKLNTIVSKPFITVIHKTSNISGVLVGYTIVAHLDVVGASPVDAAQLHLYSLLNIWLQWIGQ